jgi:starch-binding outer membrane protein SusE/F
MKSIYKIYGLLLAASVAFIACEKDENKAVFEGGTSPQLTASTNAVNLNFADRVNEAIKFAWTNPNYIFNTGVSSQDVNYLLEIDTIGSNFKSAGRIALNFVKELNTSFTIERLNGLLLNQLQLKPDITKTLQARVSASLGTNNTTMLTSNIFSFTAKPYATPPAVNPPASNALYITGNACASDWTNSPPATQRFTRVSNTLYELNVNLTGGNSYLFLPDFGSWNAKYGSATNGNNSNNVIGDDLKDGGSDMKAPAASGNYKIVVDFQRGKFTVTKN